MSLKYRPEIDGLRAIAVVAVILYHADFVVAGRRLFTGGYIGVDVFFVISGYLITSIILQDLARGAFSFLRFYDRRVRRLLPALFAVMLASLPFAWLILLPKPMKEFADSGFSSVFFSSNFYFWLEDSYWAEPSALKPFLHTWSLSVEEQFYALFPLTLLVLSRFGSKYMVGVFMILGLLSLQSADYLIAQSPDFTFYLLPTRGWELLAGAILAKIELDNGRTNHPSLEKIAPAIGLYLILFAILFFDKDTRHPPVLITTLPVAGTMLLIWFTRRGELISDLLALRPVVFVGLLSYSLYLWHYPIFAFSRIKSSSPPSTHDKFEWIALTIVLSLLTYFLLERPARRTVRFKRLVWISVGIVGLGLAGVFATFSKTDGAQFRLSQATKLIDFNYFAIERGNRPLFFTYEKCWLSKEFTADGSEPFSTCRAQEPESRDFSILVLGDSHMAGLIPGLIEHFGRENVVERVVNACRPTTEIDRPDNFCAAAYRSIFTHIDKIRPDVVLIGGNYISSKDVDMVEQVIDTYLTEYKDKVIVVGPLPRWGDTGAPGLPHRLNEIYFSMKRGTLNGRVSLAPDPKTFSLDHAVRQMASRAQVDYLSPVSIFCSTDGKCLAKQPGDADQMTQWDYAHLTASGSRYLIDHSAETIERLLPRNSQ